MCCPLAIIRIQLNITLLLTASVGQNFTTSNNDNCILAYDFQTQIILLGLVVVCNTDGLQIPLLLHAAEHGTYQFVCYRRIMQ